MASAGTVEISFAAETAKFTAELQKVNGRLKGIEGSFKSLERVAKVALGAFSVGAVTAFIKGAAQAADELGKTADRLGVSTESLKTFQIAAQDAGVSVEATTKLLQDSQKRLGEAAAGTGEAAKFIKLLGLSVSDLRALSPEQLFATYSDAINRLANRSDQLAAASALMGKGAVEAFNLIRGGSKAIDDAGAFVERFGLALSRVDVRQIEQANDALSRLQQVSSAAGQRIAAGLAPAVEFLAGRLLEATGNTKDLQAASELFSSVVITAYELVANAVRSLQSAFFGLAAAGAKALETITNPKVIGALQNMPGPLGAIALALGPATENLSASFAASVKANLAKADEALSKIKNIQQIQEIVTQALEDSRIKAEQSVAEQAARDAASRAGGLTLGDDIGLNQEQQLEISSDAAKAAADRQKEIQKDLTEFTFEELQRRSDAEQATREFQLQQEQGLQQAMQSLKAATVNAAIGALQAFAGHSKKAAIALVLVNKALAITSAIQNTAIAVTKAIAFYGPTPAGFAAAATAKALGAAQIALIAAAGFGEIKNISAAGGAPIGSPSNPINTQSQLNDQQQFGATSQAVTQVIIQGDVFSSTQTVEWFIEQIKEAVDERDVIIFGAGSRQAKEMVAVNG